MPNINAPKGFVPKRHLDGSPFNGQLTPYLVPAADSTVIGIGDVVVSGPTAGTAGLVVSGMDCEGMPSVTRATVGTTGQNIVGVVMGFLVDPTNLALKYRPASTNRIALVVTDPTCIYEVQEDAVTTPLAAADIGLNVAFNLTAVNTATGVSAMTITSASKAVTATLPFKLMGLSKRPDNNFNTGGASTDQAKFDVMLNTQIYAPNTLGVA